MRKRRRRDAPDGGIGFGTGIGIGIGGTRGVGLSAPVPASVPASVPTGNETNGIASLMTQFPMTPSLVYKPILSYFFISPISILETLSSNFSTGVIFSLVK